MRSRNSKEEPRFDATPSDGATRFSDSDIGAGNRTYSVGGGVPANLRFQNIEGRREEEDN